MQERLALAPAAKQIPGFTIFLHLPYMALDCLPALDLSVILVPHAAAHVVAAIPLEPAAGVVRMDPALASPFRQRLARMDAKKIARGVAALRRKFSRRQTSSWEIHAGSLSGTRRRIQASIAA